MPSRVASWLAWLVTRIGLATAAIHEVVSSSHWFPISVVSDVTSDYYPRAMALAASQAPYSGFHYEYPPGTLPFLWLDRLVASTPHAFAVGWIAMMLVLDAGAMVAISLLARSAGRAGNPAWQRRAGTAAWAWVAVPAALGPVALARNDMIPAALVVIAVCCYFNGRPLVSGVAAAIAIAAKIWPLVPVIALLIVAPPVWRRRLVIGVGGVMAVAVIALASAGSFPAMVRSLAASQGHRPVELESTWAAGLAVARVVFTHWHRTTFSFGSVNFTTGTAGVLATYADVATYALLGCALAVLVAARKWLGATVGRGTPARADVLVGWFTLAYLTVSLCVTPVLSPQYVVWLAAAVVWLLLVDADGAARLAAVGAFCVAALTQLEYPFFFVRLANGDPIAVDLLVLRDVGCAALAVLAVTRLVVIVRQTSAERMRATAGRRIAVGLR